VIAVNDAVDVLRTGWTDAATMFVPESPEIAELLQARLEMAALGGELDEAHLLGAVADVESLATSAGSASGAALALRLRRTVYEYLLALDAAPPRPAPRAGDDAASPEVAALGHRASPAASADPQAVGTVEVEGAAGTTEPTTDEAPSPAPVDDHASWHADVDRDADNDAAARAVEAEQHGAEPTWQYDATALEPGWEADAENARADVDGDQLALWSQPGAADVVADGPSPGSVAGDDAALPADPEHHVRGGDDAAPADGFVAARAGFHIVEEMHPNSVPGDGPTAPFSMPSFGAEAAEQAAADAGDVASPGAGTAAVDAATPPSHGWVRPAAVPAPPAAPPSPPALDADNGWRVRSDAAADVEARNDDPLASDPKYAETRRRVEDRLRRKRCDEAAALLQELAQEPGGRAVAELAMNAGDRCQSLGKSNAALNCFLAASRADPVYEQPLSRLADICIDDQDGDLAVSYLERVARLCSYRGDEKGVLRVYRRIATIAPYREDILQALLAAQSTGRLEP
jgi:hypothetical protein